MVDRSIAAARRSGRVWSALFQGIVSVALLFGLGATASCGATQLGAGVTRSAVNALLPEEAMVDDTCSLLGATESSTLVDALVRHTLDVRVESTLLSESRAQLDALFKTLGVKSCKAEDVLKLPRAPTPACDEALKNVGRTALARALAGELRAPISEDGPVDLSALLQNPFNIAVRINLAPALIALGVELSSAVEREVDQIANATSYAGPLLRPVLDRLAAELVAYSFELIVDELARAHAIGYASMARTSCGFLKHPRGPVATRLLRRSILRWAPSKLGALTATNGAAPPTLRVEPNAPTNTPPNAPPNADAPYPLLDACRKLRQAGSGDPCNELSRRAKELVDPDPDAPPQVPPPPTLDPPIVTVGSVGAIAEELTRAEKRCVPSDGGDCSFDQIMVLAGLLGIHPSSPGVIDAPISDELAKKLDALADAAGRERRDLQDLRAATRDAEIRLGHLERKDGELTRLVEGLVDCTNANREAKARRFEALKIPPGWCDEKNKFIVRKIGDQDVTVLRQSLCEYTTDLTFIYGMAGFDVGSAALKETEAAKLRSFASALSKALVDFLPAPKPANGGGPLSRPNNDPIQLIVTGSVDQEPCKLDPECNKKVAKGRAQSAIAVILTETKAEADRLLPTISDGAHLPYLGPKSNPTLQLEPNFAGSDLRAAIGEPPCGPKDEACKAKYRGFTFEIKLGKYFTCTPQ